MGTTRRLKEFNPNIQGYALEPKEELHGLEGLKHMGSSIIPGIYKEEQLDGKISVSTEDAYDMVETLEKKRRDSGRAIISGSPLWCIRISAKNQKRSDCNRLP